MSEFYRFPAMASLGEYKPMQQAVYICGETKEAIDACAFYLESPSWSARRGYGMELMDVIHAAETALRMEFSDADVEMLRDAVERKNRESGYYGNQEVRK